MKYILTTIPNFIVKNDYDVANLTKKDSHPLDLLRGNSGNCMFWEGTKKIIQNETSCELLDIHVFLKNKDKYIDKIESVALTLANCINSVNYDQLNSYYELTKDLNCKKFIFSIGTK